MKKSIIADSQLVTFNNMPEAIAEVLSMQKQIKFLLSEKAPEQSLKAPINTKQLCDFLGVTEMTITKYRKKGVIPFFTIGSAVRYDLDKVIAALEKKKRIK